MPTPAEQEQAILTGLNARIARAVAAFDTLTEYRGDNGAYYPTPDWQTKGALLAISQVLVEAGLLTDTQMAIFTAMKQVGILEQSLEEAREHLRETTGIIAPVGAAGRPQG